MPGSVPPSGGSPPTPAMPPAPQMPAPTLEPMSWQPMPPAPAGQGPVVPPRSGPATEGPDETAAAAPESLPAAAPVAHTGGSEPGVDEAEPADPDAAATGGADGADIPQAVAESPVQGPVGAPVVPGDWLAGVCPYLASEDGTYRSAEPDEGHRCTVQDPPGTLPLAFQERFCLTDRHTRCEMYKFAQEGGEAGGTPAAELRSATARTARTSSGAADSRRPIVVAAAIAGIAIIVFLFVLLLGSCSSEPAGPAGEASPSAAASGQPAKTTKPERTPEPTPEPDADSTPDLTTPPSSAGFEILYQVQEDEGLVKIAQTFGTDRPAIVEANGGFGDKKPYVEAGDVIVVPVSGDMTIEEVEAVPGFQGLAP